MQIQNLVPDGTLRKVRNNIDRLFDKNLADLIRGIRNNKENESRYIGACIEDIKVELRQDSNFVKANAIEKLAYLQMLGYDISWASFNIIEVMASTKFNEKRIGYFSATQAFNDETDVLMLTTNLIRKDLQSSNIYDVGVALSGLSCFVTTDLAQDLEKDVINLLSSSRPYVRKKALLLLFKMFLKYPDALRTMFPKLKERLEDQDPGVQSAAVNVVCELARKNPRNYLPLQNIFFKLLNTSSNNWMLIKIIKLFGSLVPFEPKLGRRLLEPLTSLINSTSAMSLLYEKYLGLLAMGRILQTHPKAVQAHKDIVLRCLDDKDESIRLRALDLLYGMISKKNIMEIVRKLMEHLECAEGSFYRDELLRQIVAICSHDNYKYITNFEWYISVLVELTKVEGTKYGVLIAEQIQDVAVRVQSVRHFAVSQMVLLVQNVQPLLQGNSATQRTNMAEVLLAAAWICGEYAQHVNDVDTLLEAMLKIKLSIVPGALLSVFLQNMLKLYALQLCKLEADEDWDGVETLDNLFCSKLPEFQYMDHLEAQERSCNFLALLNFATTKHAERIKIGASLAKCFEDELNPVAPKAQRRVPLPEGLNLDEWINEPDTLDNNEEEEDEDASSVDLSDEINTSHYERENLPQHGREPRHSSAKIYDQKPQQSYDVDISTNGIVSTSQSKIQKESEQKRRQVEQLNNPFYVKDNPKQKRVSKNADSSNNSERTQTEIHKIQNPLEIDGVFGLDKFMKQKDSTIHWKNLDKKKNDKKTRKNIKSNKKQQNGNLFKTSDEEDVLDGNRAEQNLGDDSNKNTIYKGDGEMPEGALLSSEEDEKLNANFLNIQLVEVENVDVDNNKRSSITTTKSTKRRRKCKETIINKEETLEDSENVTTTSTTKTTEKKKKLKKKGSKKIVQEDKQRKKLTKLDESRKGEYASLDSPINHAADVEGVATDGVGLYLNKM
uniref:AP-3 complex subunit delta n=1 Tax=Meloidogyne hapla TaxID=6305 RepID=A0A1I8BU09_MELHA